MLNTQSGKCSACEKKKSSRSKRANDSRRGKFEIQKVHRAEAHYLDR